MFPPIVYLMNTEYPNPKAHSVQITKMLFSLSQYSKVTFICNGFTVPKSELIEEIYKQYGIDLSVVNFREISKKKLTGISFFFTLRNINDSIEKDSVFYTRSYSLAKRLARTKFIHKKNVILESHKKSGYYKEDKVTNSAYMEQRRHIEKGNKDIHVIKNIYKSVNGIVFTSNESRNIAAKELGLKHTTYVWYPLIRKPRAEGTRKGIIYCGSLGPTKLIDLLLDALALAPSNHVVDLIGGSPEDVLRVRSAAERLGLSKNIRFLDRVPAKELPLVLERYAFGLSLMEGLKVTEYIECGLTPVIPRIPMYEAIFDAHDTVFFEPDSAASLRQKLDSLNDLDVSHFENLDILERYSAANTARKIFELIEECDSNQTK